MEDNSINTIIFIQKCILPWKTENKNAFKVQYVLCQHNNKYEQQQLDARSGNGVGWCAVCVQKVAIVSVQGILLGTLSFE